MDQVEQAQKVMVKPLVEYFYLEYLNSSDYTNLEKYVETPYEKETIVILEVYNRVQEAIANNEIVKILDSNDTDLMMKTIIYLYRAVNNHEMELYKLSRLETTEDRELSCMDTFSAMVSNEKIAIFEVVEGFVQKYKESI